MPALPRRLAESRRRDATDAAREREVQFAPDVHQNGEEERSSEGRADGEQGRPMPEHKRQTPYEQLRQTECVSLAHDASPPDVRASHLSTSLTRTRRRPRARCSAFHDSLAAAV